MCKVKIRPHSLSSNRGFSSAANASSRVSVAVRVETDPAKNAGHPMIGSAKVAISPTHLNATGQEKNATGPMLPKVTASQDKSGNVNVSVQENVRNAFQPGGNGIRSNVNISVNQSATNASVQGSVSGSPSFEANFTSQSRTTNLPLQTAPQSTTSFIGGVLFKNQRNRSKS
jgi:hypothetical protein